MTQPIRKILVYLSNGEVKRIELSEEGEAFYKEERLERDGSRPMLLVDCFFAGASVTDIPTGK